MLLQQRGFWFLLLTIITYANKCPGRPTCNGHGKCSRDTCYCDNRTETHWMISCQHMKFQHWTGVDCSLRTCPQARRWVAGKETSKQCLEIFYRVFGDGVELGRNWFV